MEAVKVATWSEVPERTPVGATVEESVGPRGALGRFHPVTAPLLGHVGVTARTLPAHLATSGTRVGRRAELTTAVKYDMDITHVLLNNSSLGKITKEQRAGMFEVWQTSLHNPEFAEYARICGAFGEIVTDPELV